VPAAPELLADCGNVNLVTFGTDAYANFTIGELFEKDRYILLKLPTEAPGLRAATYSATFDLLVQQLTTTYLAHHFSEADRAVLRIKSYIMQQCFVGLIGGYFDERPDYLPRDTLVEEVTRLIQVYLATAGEA